MKLDNLPPKAMAWGVTAGIAIFFFQACVAIPRPNETRPFVLSFDVTPGQASPIEEGKFIAALNNYALPEASKVEVNGQLLWPKATLTTNRVVKGENRSGNVGTIWGGTRGGTRLPTKAFMALPRSTQYVAFKDEDKMRAFLSAIKK